MTGFDSFNTFDHFDTVMREVLTSARYDRLTGRTVDMRQLILDAVRRFIAFLAERLSFRLPDFGGSGALYFNIFISLVVLALLIGAGIAVRLLIKHRKTPVSADLTGIFEELAARQYTLAELLVLHQQHADAGDYRSAVRYRFIAVLVALHEQHILRIENAKTNTQLLTELTAAAPPLAVPFTEVVAVFHYTWFGHKPLTQHVYTRFMAQTQQLMRQDGGGE